MIKLPRHSLVFILICAAGVAAYWLLAIFPFQRSHRPIAREIASLKRQLKTQQVLLPTYSRLLALRQKAPLPDGELAPADPAAGISSPELQALPKQIGELARQQGLTLARFQVDMDNLINEAGRQAVGVVLYGEPQGFRRFLLQLGRELPSLAAVETIEIRSPSGRNDLECELRFSMARSAGQPSEAGAPGAAAKAPGKG